MSYTEKSKNYSKLEEKRNHVRYRDKHPVMRNAFIAELLCYYILIWAFSWNLNDYSSLGFINGLKHVLLIHKNFVVNLVCKFLDDSTWEWADSMSGGPFLRYIFLFGLLIFILGLIFCKRVRWWVGDIISKSEYRMRYKEYKHERKQYWGKIAVCDELEEYESTIQDLCKKLEIPQLIIKYERNGRKNVKAIVQENCIPKIVVYQDFFDRLSRIPDAGKRADTVKIIMGHELAHIHFHDDMNRYWSKWFYTLLWFGLCVVSLKIGARFAGTGQMIGMSLLLLWGIFLLVFASVTVTSSYWGQVKEFRADRYAVNVSGANLLAFGDYLAHFPSVVLEEEEGKPGRNSKYAFRNILRVITNKDLDAEELEHPSDKRRKREVESGRAWSIAEYFRYGFEIRILQITGKGTRL